MASRYRVVDDGTSLTIGLVTYDCNDEPATVQLDVLHASQLSILTQIIADIRTGITDPVLSLEGSGCEVIYE
jgi:hypothetical protein